ncbi:MAG: serine/threonine protein phosphatase [Paracoccaceae bacterium]|nr:MAG: serine/threonine protein phosphatase [Paracoccaceae bacterium]
MHTDGRRIYAIGDIHGCLADLAAIHHRIRADLAADPHDRAVVVHVGDYVDRGPDSRGVIEALIGWDLPAERICLMGNHDDLMLKFLDQPHGMWCRFHWLDEALGGRATLASYGVAPGGDPDALAAAARAAIPARHLEFLRGLARSHRIGDFIFVHAGLRPGRALEDQDPEDLIWIRGEFLDSDADHGGIVVHGHTPAARIELRHNRINIDTGCVFGRSLSCIRIEGGRIWALEANGLRPLRLPPGPRGRPPLRR